MSNKSNDVHDQFINIQSFIRKEGKQEGSQFLLISAPTIHEAQTKAMTIKLQIIVKEEQQTNKQ